MSKNNLKKILIVSFITIFTLGISLFGVYAQAITIEQVKSDKIWILTLSNPKTQSIKVLYDNNKSVSGVSIKISGKKVTIKPSSNGWIEEKVHNIVLISKTNGKVSSKIIKKFKVEEFSFEDENSINPETEFKNYFSGFIKSYTINNREFIEYAPKSKFTDESYSLVRFGVDKQFKYSIVKTNSITAPYEASCQFTLKIYNNGRNHSTEEEAKSDTNVTYKTTENHLHKYKFIDNEWVFVSGVYKSDASQEWKDCDDDNGWGTSRCKEIGK